VVGRGPATVRGLLPTPPVYRACHMASGFTPNVLLFGATQARSRDVCNLLQERGLSANCVGFDPVPDRDLLRAADVLVCVLDPDDGSQNVDYLTSLLTRAQADSVPALIWGTPTGCQLPDGQLIDWLPADMRMDEVIGRLTALARYAPAIKKMEKELQQLQRLGRHLNRYFDEIDQEMRLAGRLQRDFMPHTLPEVTRLHFAQLYRPAAWVSGDIFDVFAIDDRHVAIFIADAMGHGTAAGLMTMFLRRALVPRQLSGDAEYIVPPAEAIYRLHEGLARQDLPHAQFVTAAYAIIDTESLDVRLARGGHPYPLRVNAAGEISEMRCEGGLLGVAGLEPEFSEHDTCLAPGDKLVFYTDGLEDVFIYPRDPDTGLAEPTSQLRQWATLDADAFVSALTEHLDRQEGSLNPKDDITVVVTEVIG
jgi:sigma-B regulation protein RsbU (phosphoserine phosphatase)